MKYYFANHLSPRDFNNVNRDQNYLIRNYATRIRNYTQANVYSADLDKTFADVFGSTWYCDASFKQLCNVAKLVKKFRESKQEFKPERLAVISDDIQVSIAREVLSANSYVKAFAKIFGKKAANEFLAQAKIYGHNCDSMGISREHEVLCELKDALKVAMFIKKNAPKEFAKSKSVFSWNAVRGNIWDARNEMELDAKEIQVLPQAMRDRLKHDGAVYLAKMFSSTANDLDRLQANLRSRIRGCAYRMTYYDSHYRDYHAKKLARYLREYDKACEFENLLRELEMEIKTRGWYSVYRVNRKMLTAMKQVAKLDVDIAAKQKTVRTIACREYRNSASRVVWSPELIAKGEE